MTSTSRTAGRTALALVPRSADDAGNTIWFCGHCGERPTAPDPPALDARVCGVCGLGLLLEAAADGAPEAGEAFVVLDRSLSVCAVSRGAETLLATAETDVVNRHVTELLVPADSESSGDLHLAAAVTWAARGEAEPRPVFVRPANLFGVRMRARILHCGPPSAALLVFESGGR